MSHKPVLLQEVIDLLNIDPKGTYVDVTLGSGGHSREILSRLKGGQVVGLDYNSSSVDESREHLHEFSSSLEIAQANFKDISNVLSELSIDEVDGILADLGWSSDQLASVEGLSYMEPESKLDMRLEGSLAVKASDLLNGLGPRELETLFLKYSDISKRKSRAFSEEIAKSRRARTFETVGDLLEVIRKVFKSEDYSLYAKVFQALRIAVNDEFTNLKEFIKSSINILKPEGRLLIITFHSGEEDIVSFLFNKYIQKGIIKYVLEDKFVQPSIEELKDNINSRSAKLWTIEKL